MNFTELPQVPRLTLENVTVAACLLDLPGDLVTTDLTIEAGRIAAGPGTPVDMRRAMVFPAFIDVHTHLDKGHIQPRCPNPDGTFAGALTATATAADRAQRWDARDVGRRTDFALRSAWAHGTRAIRTHLYSVALQHRVSFGVFRELRSEWAGLIELQAVNLCGIDQVADQRTFDEIADEVAASGGVLGAVVRPNRELRSWLRSFFAAAARRGLAADLHVDESGDASVATLREVAQMVLDTGFDAPVMVGHCCSLAVQPEPEALATMDLVARAGLHVVSLPLCNIWRLYTKVPKVLRIISICSIPDLVNTHRNITYRLVPGTAVRARRLASTAGSCRYVWNTMLADQQDLYLSARAAGAKPPSVSFFTLGKAYTQLRRVTPWLQELPFAPVRYTLKYQADAWQRFFRGEGGRPRFKARRGDDRVTSPAGSFRIEGDVVRLARIGPMRMRRRGGHPYPDGVPKQVAVKRVGKRWHAVVCYEVEVRERPDDGRALGVDMNAGQVATSDGAIVRMPASSRLVARHRRQQRVAARRRKGSRRRLRMIRRAARTARKLAMRRRNWQHHVSRRLADRAATLVVEDLRVRGMTASAKGTAEQPGTNVKQKAGLNRSILQTGWGDLRRMLEYKAVQVVAVNPAYSSQTCHACGHVSAASRPCQARFKCVSCGHTAHADVNAARNILALGTGATGRRGALALATPQTRQPVSEAA